MFKFLVTILFLLESCFLEAIFKKQLPTEGNPLQILNSYYSSIVAKVKKSLDGEFNFKLLHLNRKNEIWKIAFMVENNKRY